MFNSKKQYENRAAACYRGLSPLWMPCLRILDLL